MKLVKFFCKEESGWTLNNLSLSDKNLIVGVNSSGKSKTIENIRKFAYILKGYETDLISKFIFAAEFLDVNGDTIQYSFSINRNTILEERLKIRNSEILVSRDTESCKFMGGDVVPPKDKLLIQVMRDEFRNVTIEKINLWAENLSILTFSKEKKSLNQEKSLYRLFINLSNEQKDSIKSNLSKLGFNFDEIRPASFDFDIETIMLKENNLDFYIKDIDLSTGLFRTIYLLVLLENLKSINNASKTLLIDDFCEGLDYIRAKELGKFVFDFCNNNKIQLISTSNDHFLMNVVPLKCWNIIRRNGCLIESISERDNKEIFDNFKFLGLNNFDLFSSNFLNSTK